MSTPDASTAAQTQYPQRVIISDATEARLVGTLLKAYRTLKRRNIYIPTAWIGVREAPRGGGSTSRYEVDPNALALTFEGDTGI